MDPTDRQLRYLRAAFKTAPNATDIFPFREVGLRAGFAEQETDDLVRTLSRMGLLRVYGHLRAVLTSPARDMLRELEYAGASAYLDDRQRLFLNAAFKVAPEEGNSFQLDDIAGALAWTRTEAGDVAHGLRGMGLIGINSKACYLLPAGREAARQLNMKQVRLSESDARLLVAMSEAVPKGEQFDMREVGASIGLSEGETDDAVTRFAEYGLFGESDTFGTACLSDWGWQAARQGKSELRAHAERNAKAPPEAPPMPAPEAPPAPEAEAPLPEVPAAPVAQPTPPESDPRAPSPESERAEHPHPKFTGRFLAWALRELRSKSGDNEKSNAALATLSRDLMNGAEALNAYDFKRGGWWRAKPTDDQLRHIVSHITAEGQAETDGDNGRESRFCLTLHGVVAAAKAEKELARWRSMAARLWFGASLPMRLLYALLLLLGTVATNWERIAKYLPPVRDLLRHVPGPWRR